MFGYVRPLKAELKVKDYELFKAAYCGLCHAMKKRCGIAGRFAVNYDFTFLAMLLGDECELCRRRCIASPFVKKSCCKGGAAMERAADMSVILAYMKADDAVRDREGFKYRIARAALRRGYVKAARDRGEFAHFCRRELEELSALEKKNNPSLDENADKFASVLAQAAQDEEGERKRILSQLLYQLGRFIYIADAVCDMEQDAKAGRFNAVAARYGEKPDMSGIERLLGHTAGLISSAFELLDRTAYTPVLENIIYLGLPSTAAAVLDGSFGSPHKKTKERL
ncbi:MAG: DUF5685 family protein [Oscillospiraceae bacterium]|jgi:hypothetical protein|nr:DUF5685 family protein [Oscillospiraceae bacterium]